MIVCKPTPTPKSLLTKSCAAPSPLSHRYFGPSLFFLGGFFFGGGQSFNPLDAWLAGLMTRLPVNAHAAAVNSARKAMKETLARRLTPVYSHLKWFNDLYKDLLDGGAHNAAVTAFTSEQHSFDEYAEMIETYTNIADEVRGLPNIQIFGAVYLNCKPLVETLEAKARR